MSGSIRVSTVSALEDVPGLVHGFERRHGPAGWETREDGRRRVGDALATHGRLFFLRQVHGTTVRAAPWAGTPDGDAAVTADAGLLVGVETADCLPILLVDRRRRRAAAVHAGWRGSAAGIARLAVEGLVAAGSDAADIVAALGPGIGACCYEVGDDVREAFGQAGEAFFKPGPRERPHLDVRAANVQQLLDAGIAPGQIHHLADCTFCRPDLYHSFRREGRGAGRMVNYVGWEGS